MKKLWGILGIVLLALTGFADVIPVQMRIISISDTHTGTVRYVMFDTGTWTQSGLDAIMHLGNSGTGGGGLLNIETNGFLSGSVSNLNFLGVGAISISATQSGSRVDVTITTSTNSLADKALVTSTSNTLASSIAGIASGTNTPDLNAVTAVGNKTTNDVTVNNLTVAANVVASNNLLVVQGLTSQGSFNAQNGGTISKGLTVSSGDTTLSGNAAVGTNLAVNGNLSIGGSLTSGNLAGGSGYVAANLSGQVSTGQLAAFSANTGTIGGAGNYLVVHLNSAGIPDGWSTVAGGGVGVATNAVSAVQNANAGTWYNNVIGLVFTNFSDFASNGATNTIGFNNAPFETVQLYQGGTNFVVHGATLSFTNANTQGLTVALTNGGTLTIGGSVSNLNSGSINVSNYLSYDHTTADNGSGSGTLTQNASGGDFYVTLTTNTSGQAFRVYGFYKGVNRYWKSDSSGKFFMDEIAVSDSSGTMMGWTENVLYTGATPGRNYNMKNAYEEFCLGQMAPAYWGGGYGHVGTASRLIVNALNSAEGDHVWYWGNNSNFTEIAVSAAQSGPSSPTSAVQNSDWVTIGATRSSATGLKAGYVSVASNEDFLAVWQSRGMATNPSLYVYQGTNSLDSVQYGTNRFGGFLFGRNDTFGSAFHNTVGLSLRDETNGLQAVTVSTNAGGSVYLGPTNNLQAILIGPSSGSGGGTNIVLVPGIGIGITNGLSNGSSPTNFIFVIPTVITNMVSGGQSGNGSVSVSNGIGTITFPASSGVSNAWVSLQGATDNVYVVIGGSSNYVAYCGAP